MGSRWKKLRGALGFDNLCVYVSRTQDEDAPPSSSDTDGRRSDVHPDSVAFEKSDSVPVATRSESVGRAMSSTRSISSKKTCIICLGSMKSGSGRALFTAECSHTFHFRCIVSNVNHGNDVCPVCRARWKEVPFNAPSSEPAPHGRPSRVSPVNWPDDGHMAVLRRLPRSSSSSRQRFLATHFHTSEPASYNDDEALDPRAPPSSSVEQTSSAQGVDIRTYTEFAAVQKSASVENFTVLIHVKAPATGRSHSTVPQASRAPVDVVTVLDVSGSMTGTKLALLKRAMGFVVQNLGPSDRLSVVAFSSTARRLFHLRRMTESGRQQALQAVNSLTSGGGTNIAEGLRKAVKVVEQRHVKNPVSGIILLSDGQDTYTVSSASGVASSYSRPDYESLLPASVRRGRVAHHTPVHAFGFGADHDSASMHSISEASGGTFSFIETEGIIQDAFAQCIGGLLSVVVQGLRVRVECVHGGVSICSVKSGSYSSEVTADGRKGSVALGDLYAEEERDLLVSVNVPCVTGQWDAVQHSMVLMNVGCSHRDPVSAETIHANPKDVSIPRPDACGADEAVTSIEVDRQRSRLRAAEAMTEARASAERGELACAVRILEKCRMALGETPAARSGDGLCAALDTELREMQGRMASRQRYEASGRAYVLSGMSSHSWQRATTRGSSTGGGNRDNTHHSSYLTPSMVDMLNRSQTMVSPSVRPSPSLWHPTG